MNKLEARVRKIQKAVEALANPVLPAPQSEVRERFSDAVETAFTAVAEEVIGSAGEIVKVERVTETVGGYGGISDQVLVMYVDEAGMPHGVAINVYSCDRIDRKVEARWPKVWAKFRSKVKVVPIVGYFDPDADLPF